MKHLFTIFAAAVSIPSLFCQPGVKPVPAKWLQDGRLVVPDLNFSIESPIPDAKWSYTGDLPKANRNGSTAFVVELNKRSKFVVNVVENSSKIESTNGDQFIIGMRKTFPKDWQIQDSRFEVSDVPLKDSRRFKVTIKLPNDSTYYAYGYIVSGKCSYQTVTFSPARDEPAEFSRFAQSFVLLKADANTATNTPSPNFYPLVFLSWAIWGAIMHWRYVRRGGVRATRNERLYALVAVGLGLALIAILGARGASAASLGSVTATVGTLIFSLWELSRWRVRRGNPLPVPGFQVTQPKPIWWKVIVGCLLLFTEINNRINPASNLLKASNADQQLGMDAMAVILVLLAIWLILSGARPVWRKTAN